MPDFRCPDCDQLHPGPPMAYASPAPIYWPDDLDQDDDNFLDQELCVLKGEHFFVRGLIEIPVADNDEPFAWNVWVTLSRPNFGRTLTMWEDPARADEPPYFGWLSNELPAYPESTVNLKTHLHTRELGRRPLIELEATDHPLAVEQRTGITKARVEQIAALMMHPDGSAPRL